ncbi:arginyl-tRNA synthetase [Bacillus coahuilensis p1.1.43]|uniref:arginine--tRNA ligase n=1 Tax=Bacillus coahuilensis p1.1.43 TaxID=1150625 RepID=A0A147K977_9BACI|nr:arginine--tRNA ligase [Bacillus coahuilensis]KUP06897.1 arginyl-tRNA synthetase [Bacillus coahuilensis p1.1.43]
MITVELDKILKPIISDLYRLEESFIKLKFDQPTYLDHGDYSTNIAMQLAKKLKKSPMEIAQKIIAKVESEKVSFILKIWAVNPGFINIFIRWDEYFKTIHGKRDKHQVIESNAKVIVEHTSINPNKAAHIGHLRNAILGDTVVRMLRHSGKAVEVHNYIDDLGNQVADTLVALLHVNNNQSEEKFERFGDYCWEIYSDLNQHYDRGEVSTEKRNEILHLLEKGNNHIAWLGYIVAEKNVEEHLEEFKQFGIEYDLLVWERNIVEEGFWEEAFQQLKLSPYFNKRAKGELAGCWVLDSLEPEKVESDAQYYSEKVLIKSNGVLTYTAKDIAYHLWKFNLLEKDFRYKVKDNGVWTTSNFGEKRDFAHADMVINVIDHRQEYPQKMVKYALETLGYHQQARNLHHIAYGVVNLSRNTAKSLGMTIKEDKKAYTMSGRKGVGIKIKDLVTHMTNAKAMENLKLDQEKAHQLAIAAIRYYVLKYHTHTDITFDLEEATQTNGNSGIYLLYTYARMNSILLKSTVELDVEYTSNPFLNLEREEHAIFKHVSAWEVTMNRARMEYEPAILCVYLFELASLYNTFYSKYPILKGDLDDQKKRLMITQIVFQLFDDALDILGLPKVKNF